MNNHQKFSKSHLLGGTTWIFLSEILIFPTGFLTVVFLTRYLGADGYGLFSLAATIISWLEWSINSIFSRTTIKFVGEAEDWRNVATMVLRVQLASSFLVAIILALLAPAIANWLDETQLKYLLWLFALEIPIFGLAQTHRNILTGLGNFNSTAISGSVRWLTRLLFIVFFVQLGLSISGAILGSLTAMLLELLICRYYIRPTLSYPTNFKLQKLVDYALPLLLSALAIRLCGKLDLIALKAFGGTTEAVGIYAVAQNLALLGGAIAPAFIPVSIATISRLLRQGETEKIQAFCRVGLRIILLHFPFAGLVASCATEIVVLLFGSQFSRAGNIFAILIFAVIATIAISIVNGILIASEKPQWTMYITVPLPPLAFLGYWWLIPRWGATGGAIATLMVTSIGAIAAIVALYIRWQVLPSIKTLARNCVACILVMKLSTFWYTSGWLIIIKLITLSFFVLLILGILGEFKIEDLKLVRSYLVKKFSIFTQK